MPSKKNRAEIRSLFSIFQQPLCLKPSINYYPTRGVYLNLMQTFIHYFLHFGFPLFFALVFFKKDWKKVYLILIATMLVDLDHLFADPIFQANRCSINFHFLHSYYAMLLYVVLLFFRRPFNIIGIGLLFHMFTDYIDCLMMFSRCRECLQDSPAIELLNGTGQLLGF
jgi:hypothetical protein